MDDDDIVPVIFRSITFKEPEGRAAEITAVFPTMPGTYDDATMACYAHLGQHGICDLGWYNRTRAAKPNEYADLKRELEAAPYRYRLKVYRRMTPRMRKARREELRQYKAAASA
jgi:hypothetical protein